LWTDESLMPNLGKAPLIIGHFNKTSNFEKV
jgi:hypothetical protein